MCVSGQNRVPTFIFKTFFWRDLRRAHRATRTRVALACDAAGPIRVSGCRKDVCATLTRMSAGAPGVHDDVARHGMQERDAHRASALRALRCVRQKEIFLAKSCRNRAGASDTPVRHGGSGVDFDCQAKLTVKREEESNKAQHATGKRPKPSAPKAHTFGD